MVVLVVVVVVMLVVVVVVVVVVMVFVVFVVFVVVEMLFKLVCQHWYGEDWWRRPATTFAPAIRHQG